jgi:hypothetical protein
LEAIVSILHNTPDVVFNAVALTAATGSVTSEWRDADDLNGCQFFVTYTGTATVNVTAECSVVGGASARAFTRGNWSKSYTVKNGVSATEGFIAPPDPPFDRPFGSYRVTVTTDANITNLRVAVCRHGSG